MRRWVSPRRAKGLPGAREWDDRISRSRRDRDWEGQMKLAIDPERARRLRDSSRPHTPDVCTMCGDLCAIKRVEEFFRKKGKQE